MMAFELAGGRAAGAAFIDALSIPERTASLGSIQTMVVHPPSTTHRQLDEPALAEAGIAPGLLRVSVGIEDIDDLIADFDRALAAVGADVTEAVAPIAG
jgi:O-acetylhomoserine (thiol)-lyase